MTWENFHQSKYGLFGYLQFPTIHWQITGSVKCLEICHSRKFEHENSLKYYERNLTVYLISIFNWKFHIGSWLIFSGNILKTLEEIILKESLWDIVWKMYQILWRKLICLEVLQTSQSIHWKNRSYVDNYRF